jgi:hypothetical protein
MASVQPLAQYFEYVGLASRIVYDIIYFYYYYYYYYYYHIYGDNIYALYGDTESRAVHAS